MNVESNVYIWGPGFDMTTNHGYITFTHPTSIKFSRHNATLIQHEIFNLYHIHDI